MPVAAATYLASKVFEAQVNQLSSGVYAVSGDLDNPQVVFERVFDANSRLPDGGGSGVRRGSAVQLRQIAEQFSGVGFFVTPLHFLGQLPNPLPEQ